MLITVFSLLPLYESQDGGGRGGVTLTGPSHSLDATAGRYIWDDSSPMPFETGGQVPPMGWVPTHPPEGTLPPMLASWRLSSGCAR